MRVQICRQPTASAFGIPTHRYREGLICEIGAQLAAVFLAQGWATPASEQDGPPAPDSSTPFAALVLVVDDDPDLRRMTVSLLTGNGHGVIEARHGEEAMARLSEHPPDLVIMDLHMPVMDGWQFRAAQQRLPDASLAATPVLLLTSADSAGEHAATLRAVGLVTKPFEPDQLLQAIQEALTR